MLCLERNKRDFWYSLFREKMPITDEDGNETGESEILYHNPVKLRGNISTATGNTSVEQFGNSLQYDKVIVLDDTDCPIDEHSVLFIDIPPTFDADGAPICDYIVKKVARSLNSVSIAISKVEVS